MIKEKSDFFHRVENEAYQEYCLLMERSDQEPLAYGEWLNLKDSIESAKATFDRQDAEYEAYCLFQQAAKEDVLPYYDWLKKTEEYEKYVKETYDSVSFPVWLKYSDGHQPLTFESFHKFNEEAVTFPELLQRAYIAFSAVPDPSLYDMKLLKRLESEIKKMTDTKDIRSERDLAEAEIVRLSAEVERLTADRERAIFFKKEAEKETNKLGRLNVDLQHQVEEIQRSYDELAKARVSEHERSNSFHDKQQTEIKLLSDKYDEISHVNDQLRVTVKSLTEDLEYQRKAVEQSSTRYSDNLRELEAENKDLRSKVHNWNVLCESLTKDLEQARKPQLPTFHPNAEEYKIISNALDLATADLDQACIDHKQEIEQYEKEITDLDLRISRLTEELDAKPMANGERRTPANQSKYPHYFVEVPNVTHVDISWVLRAFSVPCCEGHAIKKLMAAGKRGAKDKLQDLKEARDSITRAIEMEEQQ